MNNDEMEKKLVKNDPAQTQPPTPILMGRDYLGSPADAGQTEQYLKNIDYSQTLDLASQIDYAPGQVASKTLAQTPAVGLTLFAMAVGEGISAHKSTGDAFLVVLEGRFEVTIDDKKHQLAKGQCIVMPAGHPHAVHALENAKMLLVVVFPAV